jgi:hypothetical protein
MKVYQDIANERNRQDLTWGEQNHKAEKWVSILGEEFGELCQAVNDTIFDNPMYKGGYDNIRKEAVHVAAVAVAMIECLDRYDEQPWHLSIGYLK